MALEGRGLEETKVWYKIKFEEGGKQM